MMRALVRSAEDVAGATTRVQLSYDLMELCAAGGFDGKGGTKQTGRRRLILDHKSIVLVRRSVARENLG
jgi:hypothetical protein